MEHNDYRDPQEARYYARGEQPKSSASKRLLIIALIISLVLVLFFASATTYLFLNRPSSFSPVHVTPSNSGGSTLVNTATTNVTVPTSSNLTLVSDAQTQWDDNGLWENSVAAWVYPGWPSIPGATWIWKTYQVSQQEAINGVTVQFRRDFNLQGDVFGTLTIGVDNEVNVYFNGQFVEDHICYPVEASTWTQDCLTPVSLHGHEGQNELLFTVTNYTGAYGQNTTPEENPAGLIYEAVFQT